MRRASRSPFRSAVSSRFCARLPIDFPFESPGGQPLPARRPSQHLTTVRRTAQHERGTRVRDRTILDLFSLDGRVAIVTGASSGLGIDFARALAEAGADVALAARREDRLATAKSLVEDAGRRAITVRTDVSNPEDCQALVDATVAEFGKVDILVNNAGLGTAYPATRETPEQF